MCCIDSVPIRNSKRLFSGRVKRGCSPKIYEHFLMNGQTSVLDSFPKGLKKITRKKDISFYVADQKMSDEIVSRIARFHNKDVPFFEINPGACILTKSLLSQLKPQKLVLIEGDEFFTQIQTVIQWHCLEWFPCEKLYLIMLIFYCTRNGHSILIKSTGTATSKSIDNFTAFDATSFNLRPVYKHRQLYSGELREAAMARRYHLPDVCPFSKQRCVSVD